ncbi:MAG: oligopeptide transporter, OPT family [Gammaproteobacteria bacterium]|nr:oligopeptide transporter, OPT family [Gammaproteobacteria bacterium]
MLQNEVIPLISADQKLPEITFRAVILSLILVVLLGAANAYLGLKVGLTISASIPAAVISMSVLRWFKNSNVLENSIVQTAASSGEALVSGIIFTIPALLLLHFWADFNYWQTVLIGIIGGTFGVLFSIPVRRALINDRALLFPEGMAIANVLKASVNSKLGMAPLIQGGIIGSVISFAQGGLQLFSDSVGLFVMRASSVWGLSIGFTPAMIAAGYIVGVNIAIGILVGVVLTWGIILPILSHAYVATAGQSAMDVAMIIFKTQIKYIGLGAYLVGGLWTFINLIKPLTKGIKSSIQATRKGLHQASVPRTDRDIPFKLLIWMVIFMIVPLYFLLSDVLSNANLQVSASLHISMTLLGVGLCVICGFILAAICAYFAGLIGSSSSPISGAILIMLLITCLIFAFILKHVINLNDAMVLMRASAYTVMITAVVATMGAISNDTMQDMKSGQMLGSTPWKQQMMLIIGTIAAALVIPEVLKLLYNAYGIAGSFPHPGMDPSRSLSAPQASLVAAVAEGIFNGKLPWHLVSLGAGIALVFIIFDAFLRRRGLRLPILAVAMGIYLPTAVNTAIIMGGLLSYFSHRKQKLMSTEEGGEQNATLFACGTVAGSALMGVVLAIPFVIFSSSDILKIMPDSLGWLASILGVVSGVFLLTWMYRASRK